MEEELKKLMDENETILYRIKPNKMAYIFSQFSMISFHLILVLAFLFIMAITGKGIDDIFKIFNELIVFYTILFGIYAVVLGFSIMYLLKLYKNTFYIVTDKAIYVSTGGITKFYYKNLFTKITSVALKSEDERNAIDVRYNVSDIYFYYGDNPIVLICIEDYEKIYNSLRNIRIKSENKYRKSKSKNSILTKDPLYNDIIDNFKD